MAVQALADFSDALSQLFAPILVRQMNRKVVLTNLLRKVNGSGKNCAWDVTFSGITDASTYTEGADVSSYDNDTEEDAILSWGQYRQNFGISGLALSVAMSSQGNAREYLDMIMKKAVDSGSKMLSDMNGDLYAGTGGSVDIVGLDAALATTGTYAGIAKATYSEWQGNVDENSGTPRALTKSLMDSMERTIFTACGMSPSMIVTTPAIVSKYEQLLDAITRQILEKGELATPIRGLGTPVINENGFSGLHYKGIPIYRDKDATSGTMYWLNEDHIEIEVLSQARTSTATSFVERMLTDEKQTSSGLNARLEALAKTGDADKFTVKIYPQLKIDRVNAHGMIQDIAET